jgi:hypothetical protein
MKPHKPPDSPANHAHLAQGSVAPDHAQGGAPPPGPQAPFLSESPAAAYQHFLPLAQAVPKDTVRVLNIDPDLVSHNVEIAVKYFKSIQADILKKLPACPVNEYLELPTLALALLFAADRVHGKASDGEIRRRLQEVAKLRSPMLKMLEVLADPEVGIADPDYVKDIRAGKGSLNHAKDGVAIPAYFKELGPAVAGKHPFTDEQFARLSEDANWLVGQLTPEQAIDVPADMNPNALVRDQLFTLVWDRYSLLGGAVASVRGLADLEEVVPPLGARKATKKPEPPKQPPPQGSPS